MTDQSPLETPIPRGYQEKLVARSHTLLRELTIIERDLAILEEALRALIADLLATPRLRFW